MKLKISFGEGGPKGFLVRHVEKIVFGIAVLLLLVFFWFGFSVGGYEQSPSEFAADARKIIGAGADMIGGCCGTTPAANGGCCWPYRRCSVSPWSPSPSSAWLRVTRLPWIQGGGDVAVTVRVGETRLTVRLPGGHGHRVFLRQ